MCARARACVIVQPNVRAHIISGICVGVVLARTLVVEVGVSALRLCVHVALKVIAVAELQLLRSEKQDPALLLTHILPDTHVSSLSNPARSQTTSQSLYACTFSNNRRS